MNNQEKSAGISRGTGKTRILMCVIGLVLFAVLVLVDRITKNLAVVHLKDRPDIPVVDGVFVLQYLENRGAAFGILQGQRTAFLIITIAVLALIVYVYWRAPVRRRFLFLRFVLVLIGAGAIGNLADRAANGYVVDFLYLIGINFPIFNVADIYVTVAAALLIIMALFVYKDKDFKELWTALGLKSRKKD